MSLESQSLLRTDLLSEDLLRDPLRIKIIAEAQFVESVSRAINARTTTPGTTKNIIEVMDLISQAISDYELRTHTSEDAKIDVVYEKPDKTIEVETISLSFHDRSPGAFSQGRPTEGKVKNRRPVLREVIDDPDHPGYKRAILGYWYDNILRVTAWARTNKAANQRALWIENLMEEYTWFFTASGVNRILFEGWRQNETLEISGNKYYGRPMDYFVRTEKLWNLSQKTLEQIVIRLAPGAQTT